MSRSASLLARLRPLLAAHATHWSSHTHVSTQIAPRPTPANSVSSVSKHAHLHAATLGMPELYRLAALIGAFIGNFSAAHIRVPQATPTTAATYDMQHEDDATRSIQHGRLLQQRTATPGSRGQPARIGCVWVCLHVRACVRACHMVRAPTFILVRACARVPHPGVCAQGRWELKQRWQMPWADNDFQEAGAQTQHAVADSPIDPSSQHATDTMGHATAQEQYATGRIDLRRFGRHCCRTSACMLQHLTLTRSFCSA